MFALVDVNNFYASCERLFEPRLDGRPVVVLSNNDGCVIARSQEAKDLGIPMGIAAHEAKSVLKRERVHVYSSNYALYGDMSGRVVSVLKRFTPYLEVYSIDESFLDFGGFPDLAGYGREIRDTVLRWTGLPVSVGVGPTKTLAKVANRIAKKDPAHQGVFVMPDDNGSGGGAPDTLLDTLLDALPSDGVWGIGSRLAARLRDLGIHSALDLKRAEPKFIRARFSVVVERTVLELRGTPCLALEMTAPRQKGIMVSRGFGKRLNDYRHIEAAVATYASRAAEKLRRQGLSTNKLTVSLRTSPFEPPPRRYASAAGFVFPEATSDTPEIIGAARRCLKGIFRPGLPYQKAGVFLDGLEDAATRQLGLFPAAGSGFDRDKSRALMKAVDRINADWGRDTVRFAVTGLGSATGRPWAMKQNRKSPCYTTRWADIKRVGG